MSQKVDESWRPRVVVCGTKFGRVYLSGFRAPGLPFELAGIVAQGSERSQACARHYGVPLYTGPEQLPDGVDMACVVVSSSVNGGRGAELARALMARGIHVLQEHPLHHDELAGCLREARQHRVQYHLNTHYVHVAPVRRFIAAAQALLKQQRPVFVDAACGIQVAYTLFDILGQVLGGVRPWAFTSPPPLPQEVRGQDVPFRTLEGLLGGVPLTLRVQNQLDPSDPDNHAHLLHRITLGTEGGTLTLVNTHGPVLWSPRPHFPRESRDVVALEDMPAAHLDFPSATPLGPAEAPSYRQVLGSMWPAGIRRALGALRRAVIEGEDPLRRGQYHLTLCRLWQDVTSRLGYPELLRRDEPRPLPADELMAAVKACEEEELPR